MFNNTLLQLYRENPDKNWDVVSMVANPNVPMKFIEKCKNVKEIVSRNPNLTVKFIKDNIGIIDFTYLCGRSSLPEEIIDEYQDFLNWDTLCANSEVIVNNIEKYKSKIIWDWLSMNNNLTISHIKKYKHQLNMTYISSRSNMTMKYIRKYLLELDWDKLSWNPNLTEEFIEEYSDKINWRFISLKANLTSDFIIKHQDKIAFDILGNPSLDFCNENIWSFIEKKFPNGGFYSHQHKWNRISQNTGLDLSNPKYCEFVEKNIHNISWYDLSGNPTLTPEFAKKYSEKIKWNVLHFNYFNLHPVVLKRNRQKYSQLLKEDLDNYFTQRWKAEFGANLDLIRLRRRDLKMKLRISMI